MSEIRKRTYRFTDEFRLDDMVDVLKRSGFPSTDAIARWRAEDEQSKAQRREDNWWLIVRPFRRSKVA